MPPEAKIILDSVCKNCRLTTMEITFHHFVAKELLTHRSLSRSASSQRAQPINKIIKSALDDPAIPIFWGKNQKGMSAEIEMSPEEVEIEKLEWLKDRDYAVESVKRKEERGLHKQLANRILEPFIYCTYLVTATDWENFFALRTHKTAQPEIQHIAILMSDVYYSSQPKSL